MNSFAELLITTASRQPDAVALTDGNQERCYAALASAVERMAAGLVRLGLQRRDRVAVYLDKTTETVVTLLAVNRAGGVFVPINPKLKPAQVRHILRDCAAVMLLTSHSRLSRLAAESGGLPPVVILVDLAPDAPPDPSACSFAQVLQAGSPGVKLHRTIDIDPSAILYTSGSTGLPKGVTVSQRNLVVGAQSVNAYLGTRSDDVILSLLPLSFDAGLSQLTTGFAAGARVVLHNYLRAQEAAALCAGQRVTSITGVPPLWSQLMSIPWPEAARQTVRLFANTGGAMTRPLLAQLRAAFPRARPFLMYGLTEAFRSTYLDPAEVDRRPDSIGKAIPNAEILVLREDGTHCEPGEIGELVHRGALVTLGYWNDPVRTAERFRPTPAGGVSGLLPEMAVWSGDLVRTDEEGFLYFVGRRDELIKSFGYRISPTEIESVVVTAAGVKEVAAFAIPDRPRGNAS